MRLSLIALCLLTQSDPYRTLAEHGRRAREADRKAALEHFRARERGSALAWAAARLLERSDQDWRLRYDRLTTKDGVQAGRVAGALFYSFSGQQFAATAGTLEQDALDPAALELDACFARFPNRDTMTEQEHLGALEALAVSYEKVRARSHGYEALRLFALAHASVLGDRAVGTAPRLGLVRTGGRWGTPEQVTHYVVALHHSKPERVDPATEAVAKGSPVFGARYAWLILQIHDACASGSGRQATFEAIASLPVGGGPAGAADHLRALATGFKAALQCKECKNGRATCSKCQGKGKSDVTCEACKGSGRTRAPGAVGGADVTQKCRNCDGKKVFKDVGCPECSKSGQVACASCKGKPWRDRVCANKDCRGGRIACSPCKGSGQLVSTCQVCGGTGRSKAPGTVGSAVVTQKCRTCEDPVTGRHGDGKLRDDCKTCAKTGRVNCPACGPMGSKQDPAGAAVGVSAVFTTDVCAECRGEGWPLPNVAVACPKCLGLGVRVKPAADPARTLN